MKCQAKPAYKGPDFDCPNMVVGYLIPGNKDETRCIPMCWQCGKESLDYELGHRSWMSVVHVSQ